MILGMNLGPHADFIVAAYAVAALVLVAMIGWVILDYRAQKQKLAQLENQGVTRRSERQVERLA
ncbi:heme exporter protein CcmD [Rhodoplanes sp. Z2-YC6860]|jgi:heme exporter protein D|uniref:heme exporter protein CcmD n=1 Tax=Rhodoplanes sp. Z2-YC6860 TaxID=674703 RepID=UPI00078B55C3|nr:heme exporter protein CcmD [Rhodoplanes sp. Z2-YC6860]